MTDWQSASVLDETMVRTLIDAVGSDTFAAMKGQFIDDLRRLRDAYKSAVANADAMSCRESAHALKGAASNIGLAQLAALAATLEGGDTVDSASFDAVFEAAVGQLNAAS